MDEIPFLIAKQSIKCSDKSMADFFLLQIGCRTYVTISVFVITAPYVFFIFTAAVPHFPSIKLAAATAYDFGIKQTVAVPLPSVGAPPFHLLLYQIKGFRVNNGRMGILDIILGSSPLFFLTLFVRKSDV